jgi:CheY-like chemotaxis protein
VTGEQALSVIDSHEPHLVILDVHLPDTNGFEVCRRVRKNPFHGTTRIVHTSAMSVSLEDKIESLESGADGFLEQPFELDALISCVRSLLDPGQAAQPVAHGDVSGRAEAPTFEAPPTDHLLDTLEDIDDGVICLDASWRFTFVNAMAEQVLGRKRNELLGQVIWAAMPTLEASPIGNGYRRAMTERTPVTLTGLRPAFNAFMHARALPTPHGLLVLFQPRAEQSGETAFVGKRTLRGV